MSDFNKYIAANFIRSKECRITCGDDGKNDHTVPTEFESVNDITYVIRECGCKLEKCKPRNVVQPKSCMTLNYIFVFEKPQYLHPGNPSPGKRFLAICRECYYSGYNRRPNPYYEFLDEVKQECLPVDEEVPHDLCPRVLFSELKIAGKSVHYRVDRRRESTLFGQWIVNGNGRRTFQFHNEYLAPMSFSCFNAPELDTWEDCLDPPMFVCRTCTNSLVSYVAICNHDDDTVNLECDERLSDLDNDLQELDLNNTIDELDALYNADQESDSWERTPPSTPINQIVPHFNFISAFVYEEHDKELQNLVDDYYDEQEYDCDFDDCPKDERDNYMKYNGYY